MRLLKRIRVPQALSIDDGVFNVTGLYRLKRTACPVEGFVLPEVNDRNLAVVAVCFDEATVYLEPVDEDGEPLPNAEDVGLWTDPADLEEQDDG